MNKDNENKMQISLCIVIKMHFTAETIVKFSIFHTDNQMKVIHFGSADILLVPPPQWIGAAPLNAQRGRFGSH